MNLYNIIIPAYNSSETIEATVDSLQKSGLSDFSIIILDDGSIDATVEKCKKIESKYDNIKYISQKNQGVSATRNNGIKLADAEYLIFFDADDFVDAGAFANADRIIRKLKPDMLIYGMCFDFYHNGNIFRSDKIVFPIEKLLSQEDINKYFSDMYQANALTSSCNKIIKRKIILDNNIHYVKDLFLMEDFLFSLDCIQHCESVYMLPEAIYRYRQSEDEGNAYRRIKRIGSLSNFVKPFEMRLKNHPDVFSSMYFMLLNQKLWLANTEEIKKIAEDHILGKYTAYKDADRKLDYELTNGMYFNIRLRNMVLRTRHRIANFLKRNYYSINRL